MTTEYRLAARVHTGQLDAEPYLGITQLFAQWVGSKRYDTNDLSPGRRRVGTDTVLVSADEQRIDGSRTRILQLRETAPAKKTRWVTTLTIHTGAPDALDLDAPDDDTDVEGLPTFPVLERLEDGPGTWVQLDVDYEPLENGPSAPMPAVPRLARLLLESIPLLDGDVPLLATPVWVSDQGDLEDLEGDLGSRRRHLPLLIAAARERDTPESALDHYSVLAAHLPGYASMAVVSQDLAPLLNQVLGPQLQLLPGQIRTLEPRPRPNEPGDAVRHRLMGVKTATSDPRRAARMLAARPRARALALALPPALAALREAGEEATRNAAAATAAQVGIVAADARAAAQTSLAAALATPESVTPDLTDAVAALTVERDRAAQDLGKLAGVLDILNEQVTQLTDQAQEDRTARASAERQARELEADRDEQITEADTLGRDLGAARDRIRWLERRALEYQDYEAKQETPFDEQSTTPNYLSDLVEQVAALDLIGFVADERTALDLDDHMHASTWARRAWEALLAMQDYARARAAGDWSQDFHTWCAQTPPGRRGLGANYVVTRESETTMTMFGGARVFPVPLDVDPSGRVTMQAHIRVGGNRPPAPRMHFHDDSGGVTGKIWVGYLGEHLPTPATKRM